jgi:membrane-bound metal-dependent hydrolase YbcI (DUF457 family)
MRNLFNRLKWFLAAIILMSVLLAYANISGWRLLSTTSQQNWSANRAGNFHK